MVGRFSRIDPRAGLAASTSDVPSWRDWLSGGSGGSGLEPGSPADVRARAETSYTNQLAESRAYGSDATGQAPKGLWTSLLDVVDAPRQFVFDRLVEPLYESVSGEELDESAENYGDLPFLQADEDDPMWQRVLKGAGGFAGDVATDPLTYMTALGSVLGKKAVSELAETSARKVAAGMSDDAIETFAKRSTPERAAAFVRDRLGDDVADEFAETALKRPSTLVEGRTWRRVVGENEFAGQAGQSYVAGGATGLRRYMRKELGDEAGEKAFRSMPRDVQGGLTLRAPLVRKTGEDGLRRTVSVGVGGGGRFSEAIGLPDLGVAAIGARNKVRATKLGQKLSKHMGGTDGALYGAVVKDIVGGKSGVGAHTFTGYTAVRRARQMAAAQAGQITAATQGAVGHMRFLTDTADDKVAARAAAEEWFQQPRRLNALREGMVLDPSDGTVRSVADDQGEWWASLPQAQQRGIAAAVHGTDYFTTAAEMLRGEGVPLNVINDYVSLIMTQESRLSRQAVKPVRAAQNQTGGLGGYDPSKEARQFWRPEMAEIDGQLRITDWRRMTPGEVNVAQEAREAAGEAVNEGDRYLTDPTQIITEYGDASRRLAKRVIFANRLNEAGVIARGGTDTVESVVSSALRDVESMARRTGAGWEDALRAASGRQPSGGTAVAVRPAGRGARLREAFDAVFGDVPETQREQAWGRLFADPDEVTVPPGPISERVRATLQRAGYVGSRTDDDAAQVFRPGPSSAADVGENVKVPPADPLTEQLDAVVTERAALEQATAAIVDAPPARQIELIDGLVGHMVDFQRRAVEGLDSFGDDAAETLKQARADFRASSTRSRDAVQARGVLDEGSRVLAADTPLVQIGQKTSARAEVIDNVRLPPELNVAFAPEVMAQTAERVYKMQAPGSAEAKKLIDGVYRPFLRMFKSTATVQRGYGYDARNALGGIWQNSANGVTHEEHAWGLKLAKARNRAYNKHFRAERDRLRDELDISGKAARRLVDGSRLDVLIDDELRARLGATTVAKLDDGRNVTLYDSHRMMEDNQVAMSTRLSEGLSDALAGDDVAAFTRGEAKINLFAHRRPDELNRAQRGMNLAMSNRWARHKGRVSEATEDFVRGSAFIHGLREYGATDGGESAALLAKGLHFDYDDLSDFEQRVLRGFAVPFWRFTKSNIPLQLRALARNPGLFNRANLANETMQDILGADDEAIIPEWMQEKLGWKWEGHPYAIGVETPAVDLNRFIRLGRPGEVADSVKNEVVGMLSPVIKGPIEAAFQMDTFTGAPYNPAGIDAPGWYKALQLDHVPGMGWSDDDGTRKAPQGLVDLVENSLPPVGQLERLAPFANERQQQRLGTNWLSQMAAVPATTLNDRQVAGELRGRVERLDSAVTRADVTPAQRQQVETLLDQGFPPDMVFQIVFGGQ